MRNSLIIVKGSWQTWPSLEKQHCTFLHTPQKIVLSSFWIYILVRWAIFELQCICKTSLKVINEISADKFDLLWIDLSQTRLKRVLPIRRQLNFWRFWQYLNCSVFVKQAEKLTKKYVSIVTFKSINLRHCNY